MSLTDELVDVAAEAIGNASWNNWDDSTGDAMVEGADLDFARAATVAVLRRVSRRIDWESPLVTPDSDDENVVRAQVCSELSTLFREDR